LPQPAHHNANAFPREGIDHWADGHRSSDQLPV
jgi:hypothetical protein